MQRKKLAQKFKGFMLKQVFANQQGLEKLICNLENEGKDLIAHHEFIAWIG